MTIEFHYDTWIGTILRYGIDLAPEDYYPLGGTNVRQYLLFSNPYLYAVNDQANFKYQILN